MRTKNFLFFLALMLSSTASAATTENSAVLGLNVDTVKEDLPGNLDLQDEISLAPTFGWRHVRRYGNFGIRTGILGEWKNLDVKDKSAAAGEDDIQLRAYYAAIPLNIQFFVNEKWAIFGGITPRLLLAKTCESCGSFNDDYNFFTNYTNAGITYMMGQKFGADVVFNHATSENFEDIKINTTQVLFHYRF